MASSLVDKALGFIAVSYSIALTIGSLVKPIAVKTTISNIDKLLHLGAYFGLAILWLLYIHVLKMSLHRNWASSKIYFGTASLLIIYGIVIEVLQGSTTTYRTPDVWDVLANTIGVILGSLLFMLLFKKFNGLKSYF